MSLHELLKDHPEDILLGDPIVRTDALKSLKQALDSAAQQYTPLGAVHVDGLKVDQVWVQAQMVLESVAEKLNEEVSRFRGSDLEESDDGASGDDMLSENDPEELSSEDGSDEGVELDAEDIDAPDADFDDMSAESDGASDSSFAKNRPAVDEASMDSESSIDDSGAAKDAIKRGQSVVAAFSSEEEEENEEEGGIAVSEKHRDARDSAEDNFDLKEFQQHVLQLEQDPEGDDDEDVDYFAELGDSSDDGDMRYEDFFGPAPKKQKKTRVRFADDGAQVASPRQSLAEEVDAGSAGEDEELDMVMESTRKDLFDSEDDADAYAEAGPGEPLSKFERQQRELAEQIEELESENVGEKNWGMRGEIQAKERPEDSLVNAELQFERNAKPAPVITDESTSSLEDMIKQRIRKQQFDDLPRRSELPTLAPHKELPEVQETKSQKSLAELYEEDHMRQENPEYYSKQESAAMEGAHKEIADLFASVSRRLDALSSWQYTPKAAAPTLQIVTDQPAIAMEEAQPGTMAAGTQLAPQELYKSGEAVAMANQEMSTSLKRKKRRDKAKERAESAAKKSKAAQKKEAVFGTLKRGNVTLLDKGGQKRDLRGNRVGEKAPASATNIKL